MKILVCSDGSERSRRALVSAALIAAATKAETTVLGITEIGESEAGLHETLREQAAVFREKEAKLQIVSKFGNMVTEIIRQTRETSYDLVVIGAERRGSQEFFLPSIKAYSVAEAISPPVLVVPRSRPDLKRILICSGGGAYIDNAVRFTSKIAKHLSARITLLNVVAAPPAMHARLFRRQEDDVEALLNSGSALARNLRNEKEIVERAGVAVTVRIRHGIVIDQILAEVEGSDYDLVVAGSRPVRDRWRNYMIGNLTRDIINRTDRPVLVIRSDQEPASLAARLRSVITKLASRQDYLPETS
jgi:nucleotide-binding universal stress UspA family protein